LCSKSVIYRQQFCDSVELSLTLVALLNRKRKKEKGKCIKKEPHKKNQKCLHPFMSFVLGICRLLA